ncbi:MAG: homoserine O-acetyltransferase [Acidobacteriota bacterium]
MSVPPAQPTVPPAASTLHDPHQLNLAFGGQLPSLDITYETWGALDDDRANAVLVCPAFSAHSHAQSCAADPTPGWWEGMIGPGRAIDTDRFFVLCPALLGGAYGTTGPTSTDPRTGAPYRGRFPVVAIRDIVDVHVRLLDHLGIARLHAVIGGSLGAMQAIELAVRHPTRVVHTSAASGTDVTRPYTQAVRHIGRQAIMLDPAWQNGDYEGLGPVDGLRLARQLGMLYYRSRDEFNERFGSDPIRPPALDVRTFDVQSYLGHHGDKAVGRFDANAYLLLSHAMDLHNCWRDAESPVDALDAVPGDARFQIIGCREDWLIPIDEQRGLHAYLLEAGKFTRFHEISSPVGHDAFLAEIDVMTDLIGSFLRADARSS